MKMKKPVLEIDKTEGYLVLSHKTNQFKHYTCQRDMAIALNMTTTTLHRKIAKNEFETTLTSRYDEKPTFTIFPLK